MRSKRRTRYQTVILGNHIADVEGIVKSLQEAKRETEQKLIEEREAFLIEYTSKMNEIEKLRLQLDKAQAKERSLIEEASLR